MIVNIDSCRFTIYYRAMAVVSQADVLPIADDGGFCCPPILTETVSSEDAIVAAGIFKALSDPARVRLLSAIASGGPDGVCVYELTEPMDLSQPTVSHHLKLLHDAGLVSRARRGTWVYYSLRRDAMSLVARALGQ
jgi:ArsR family transcriptional regulator, arsenate/arsenite/antimonite-responsive transcriptional repressor